LTTRLIDKHGEAVIDELVAESVQVANEYIQDAENETPPDCRNATTMQL
jgi:hypothetical protein